MTKEELSRLRNLQKEIDILEKELDNISEQYVTDKVVGSTAFHPYILTHYNISGYDSRGYSKKVKRLQKQLQRELDKRMDERQKLEEYIESVNDDIARMILRLRYINGLGWNQIGNELGYGERQVRRKHEQWIHGMLQQRKAGQEL
jgi:DNA-directed RNA polymerase specialized sigma subunit